MGACLEEAKSVEASKDIKRLGIELLELVPLLLRVQTFDGHHSRLQSAEAAIIPLQH
jgi:hypothetical protein